LASNAGLKSRELEPGTYLPYVRHASDKVIICQNRTLMTVLRLEGVSFETADTEDLNGFHHRLNTLYRNISDERVNLWFHIIRRRENDYPEGRFSSSFAASLDARYKERMAGAELYRNDLYLTILWTPGLGFDRMANSFMSRLVKSRRNNVEADNDALKKLDEVTTALMAGLQRYQPRILGLYDRDGIAFSEPSEFLHQILTGKRLPFPLVEGVLGNALMTSRVLFGKEVIEFRGAGDERYAGIFGLKEYPATTRPGMLNPLLWAPFECILAQSFGFIAKANAKTIMSRKQNQMISAQDRASSQIAQLDDAMDDLESNRMVMGQHHLNVLVFADTPKNLKENMAKAVSYLTTGGAVVAREDLALEAAFWSMLPGNTQYRPRSGAITSRNFAAFAPFHSYPIGQKSKNHWGEAIALLKTSSSAPFYFNFHEGDLGNTFICGPSGSGKTVCLNFLLAQLQKHNPDIVLFDKDRGAELFCRAANGNYLTLQNGRPTGCAPLKALELTPANKVFLSQFVKRLVHMDSRPLSVREEQDISRAIDALESLPPQQRSIGALRAFLDTTDSEGTAARLVKWQRGNALGWVFDNDRDQIDIQAKFLGYDMTDFLDNAEIRTPLMMYLFHRIETKIDGRRIVIAIDEFWKALGDEAFRDLAQNKLKTIRKQNGLMVFATQSPRDAILSPIGHTIIEQCPTQLFFPNHRGQHSDYVGGFKLTEREFELVARELTPESRRFLIKQGHNSVVAELNLSGFDDELAILSGRTAAVELLNTIRAKTGDNPADWLPEFYKTWRNVA
jgi:type IV secretion system protein VirB4